MTKDCKSKEKFCYLKNKVIYPKKNNEITLLYYLFEKNKAISFVLLQNVLGQKNL